MGIGVGEITELKEYFKEKISYWASQEESALKSLEVARREMAQWAGRLASLSQVEVVEQDAPVIHNLPEGLSPLPTPPQNIA